MRITVDNNPSVTITDSVVKKILGIYAEEQLEQRSIFKAAFETGSIEFDALRSESDKILIPWQLFLLEEDKLDAELKRIEALRLERVSEKLVIKRRGFGEITSKRILDRLIRCQNYLVQNGSFSLNSYCGSLKGKNVTDAVNRFVTYFAIDRTFFQRKNKTEALVYLIEMIVTGQINISQGVLNSHKLLPILDDSKSVYKNTSGFAIRDSKVPFIFLPSEINPDERESRQLFTLVYLTVLVGLDEYDFIIGKDFKTQMLAAKGNERLAYAITSEFFLPWQVTETYRRQTITPELRDYLSTRHKVSPTAVVVILRKRKIISSFREYQSLLPDPPPPRNTKSGGGSMPVEYSVKKFHGKYVFEFLNEAIRTKAINSIPAQYLIYGSVNKKGFSKYRHNLGL